MTYVHISSNFVLLKMATTSLTSQTQPTPTPAQIAFSIMHREGRVWWLLVGFCVQVEYWKSQENIR